MCHVFISPIWFVFAVLRSWSLAQWWNLYKRINLVDCVLHIVLKSEILKIKLIIEKLGGT
jgi:hypothetical protein